MEKDKRIECKKCNGTGWYQYTTTGTPHNKMCEICCPHNEGTFPSPNDDGKYYCRVGCGEEIYQDTPEDNVEGVALSCHKKCGKPIVIPENACMCYWEDRFKKEGYEEGRLSLNWDKIEDKILEATAREIKAQTAKEIVEKIREMPQWTISWDIGNDGGVILVSERHQDGTVVVLEEAYLKREKTGMRVITPRQHLIAQIEKQYGK